MLGARRRLDYVFTRSIVCNMVEQKAYLRLTKKAGPFFPPLALSLCFSHLRAHSFNGVCDSQKMPLTFAFVYDPTARLHLFLLSLSPR